MAHVLDILCVLWTILSSFLMVTLKTFIGLIGTFIILRAFKDTLDFPLGIIIVQAIEKGVQ